MKMKKKKKKKDSIVRDHLHYTGKLRCATHNMYIHRYKTSREIPLVFHDGSELTLHFIIKKLTEEFNVQIECLVEKTENKQYTIYGYFSVNCRR